MLRFPILKRTPSNLAIVLAYRPQVEEIDAGVLLAPMVKGVIRRDSDMRSQNKIAVLVTEHEHPYLQAEGIPVCAVGENADAIVVDHGGRARSYEWPVVIAIVCFPGARNSRYTKL